MMLAAPVAVTLRRLQWDEIITEGAFKIVVVSLGLIWFCKHQVPNLSVQFWWHIKPPAVS